MVKRQLTNEEKTMNTKGIARNKRDLIPWKQSETILKSEIEMLPIKTELALYNKNLELKKTQAQIEMYENTINALEKQNKHGVDPKDPIQRDGEKE